MEKIFGSSLVDNEGKSVSPTEALSSSDVIGVYFADSMQNPSKNFLIHLKTFYETHKKRLKMEGKRFEIVFVSFEEVAEADFDKHFAQMPWFAIPYADRQRKGKLCKRFKVITIPTLILLDAQTLEPITSDGRHRVLNDPEGLEFPWRPMEFDQILGNDGLIDCCTKREVPVSRLKGKKLGLFFAAHWCPPCRSLTGELIQTYQRLRADNKQFEMIYLSSDTNETNFNNYTSNMPWLALPFKDKRIHQFTHLFSTTGIPLLMILDEKRSVITRYGREAVQEDPEGEEFPWYPRTVEELSDTSYHFLNECACLILFTPNTDEDVDRSMDMLHHVALQHIDYVQDSRNKDAELVFLVAGNEEPVSGLVRRYAHLPATCPMLVILDVPEKKKHVLSTPLDLTDVPGCRDVIRELIAKFIQGSLTFTEIPTNFDYSYL